MQIINSYAETIAHYSSKMNFLEEELKEIKKNLLLIEQQISEGYQSRAGKLFGEKIIDICEDINPICSDIGYIQDNLYLLRKEIEYDIAMFLAEADEKAEE